VIAFASFKKIEKKTRNASNDRIWEKYAEQAKNTNKNTDRKIVKVYA